jgi:hypothetical protein
VSGIAGAFGPGRPHQVTQRGNRRIRGFLTVTTLPLCEPILGVIALQTFLVCQEIVLRGVTVPAMA